MFARPKILEYLQQAADPAVDLAIGAAIPFVDPYLQIELVETILRRNRTEGLLLLPVLFHQVNDTAKARIIAGNSHLFPILRTTIRSPETQTRINSLQIIRQSSNPRLAYLAGIAIHDGASRIRGDAALTLRDMAEQHLANMAQTTAILQDASHADGRLAATVVATMRMVNEERRFLLDALRDAVSSFESHHRTEIVEAAVLFAEELEDALFQGGALLRGKISHAMFEVIGERLLPHHAPFVYVSLAYPEFRKRVATKLATSRDSEFFAEFIRYAWIARDPRIQKHLGVIRTLEWLGDGFEPAFTLPPEIAEMAPTWILALGIPVDQKVAVLTNFLMIDAPGANRAAAWALTRIDTPASTLALQQALDHEVTSVREMAEREVQFRSRGNRRYRHRTVNERPPEWSRLIDAAGLSEDFEDIWQNFERIDAPQAHAAGRLAVQFVPGFSMRLRSRLVDPSPVQRVRALQLVMTLRLASQFNREIFNLCNDRIIEVRAAAIRSLGQIGDLTSRRILERAIVQDAASVKAAAIDALGRLGNAVNADLVVPLMEDEDAAVRAAAVRLLLRRHMNKAAGALMSMLADGRLEHRCNALSIVDQLRLTTLLPYVKDMAISDPDPRIMRSAQQVLRRLHKFKIAADKVSPVAAGSEDAR